MKILLIIVSPRKHIDQLHKLTNKYRKEIILDTAFIKSILEFIIIYTTFDSSESDIINRVLMQ